MEKNHTEKAKVLLSIVTWNHQNSICATIDSILNQTFKGCETVVFDNNSEDETVQMLSQYESNGYIKLIRNKTNEGFCGGHNYVIRNYQFDYIFLVNPDIVLRKDYIERTLQTFQLNNNIGAVCGLLVQAFEENPVIDSAGMKLTRSRRFVMIDHGIRLRSANLNSGYVSGLDGALPAFKKEAVNTLIINGEFFNSMFFSHKEDWDISWRLILFGWKTYFNRDCIAMHPRYFKPNQIKLRKQIDGDIKLHGFKNQFLLLLINEDRTNFLKDFFVIVPRILAITIFCLFFERKSLKAYSYILSNRKKIAVQRRAIQNKRKIQPREFRQYLS